MMPLDLAKLSFHAGDQDRARWLYVVGALIQQGVLPATIVDSLCVGRALDGKAWAQACQAEFHEIMISHLFVPPQRLPFFPPSWRRAVDSSKEEYKREGYVISSNDARVVLWNWGAKANSIDEVFFAMSSNNDILIDDDYWIKFFVGKTFIKFFDESSKRLFIDLNGVSRVKLSGRYILLGSRANYTHFMMNFLGKLLYISKFPELADLPIICGPLREYQLEMMELMGISRKRVIQLGDLSSRCLVAEVEQLIIPSGVPWGLASRYVADKMLQSVDIPDMPEMRKIYFSRQYLAPRHRVANEMEVQAFLISHGFTIIHPEKLTVADTIRIMRNANIAISVGGGAHGNFAFAKPSTKFICMFPSSLGESISENMIRGGFGMFFHYVDNSAVVFGHPVNNSGGGSFDDLCHYDLSLIEQALQSIQS